MELHVMDIQRFCIHDGPGIRTTVFLQGCPLRCPWCANPESQAIGRKLMHDGKKCVGCGACAAVCGANAVRMEGGGPRFDRGACLACGNCASACPAGAITYSGRTLTARQVLETVLRDRDYYDNSGGGVTLSGGEPFAQFEDMLELLRLAKGSGLHTAVETCGQVPPDRFAQALDWIDLVMMDVKHTDAERLKAVTGADLAVILRNAAQVEPEKLRLRMPVIPGFNEDCIGAFFGIAQRLGVRNVHLLPYHTLGVNKYAALGRAYALDGVGMLRKEALAPYAAQGEALGLNVTIGG